ncbi:SsrA-binding protein SmpB [bacterium]|nr:SsrA-binding protein SmpB [bacterium]
MGSGTINITNRKARFKYEILDRYEAGLALKGSEVKSVRAGGISLAEAYCRFVQNELFLFDCHIAPYPQAGRHGVLPPTRPRKLLLHRSQLKRLQGQVATRGLTIVPLRVYDKEGRVKVEIGLARGKKAVDKRRTIKKRDIEREERTHRRKLRL